jgi:tRNA A-37 threonylcarbamoyl transferase component Bud32
MSQELYRYGQLLCVAILFFNVVSHAMGGLRLKVDRARELNLAGMFLCLALHALAFARIMAGHADPLWLRFGAAVYYLVFLFIVRVIDTYRARRHSLSIVLHVVGILAAVANLYVDWPIAYLPSGDLDLWWVGHVQGARMSYACGCALTAYATVAVVFSWIGARQAQARGHVELRALFPLATIGFPLFCVGIAAFTGLVPLPPPTGFLAALMALFFTWHGLDRQAQLTQKARRQASLNDYKLSHRIGAGGMAEVFVAEKMGPEGFHKKVAVKRILAHLSDDPSFRGMFLEEARIAAKLSHPNIVTVHELGETGGVFFIVMDYVGGVSLQWLIERRIERKEPLPAPLVAQIAIQVLDALAYAHALTDDRGKPLGLVHRDVTPQNIMLDDSGVVRLLDFGLAFAHDRSIHTEAKMLKGKVAYCAPEYASGEGLDGRCDLFALGIVMYQLVCGLRPFDGPTEIATLENIMAGRKKKPSQLVGDVAQSLELVILRALERDPDKRYPTAREMATALREYLIDAGSLADREALVRLLQSERAREKDADTQILPAR